MKKTVLAVLALGAALSPTLANAGYYVPTCAYYTNWVWNGFGWVLVQQYVCN